MTSRAAWGGLWWGSGQAQAAAKSLKGSPRGCELHHSPSRNVSFQRCSCPVGPQTQHIWGRSAAGGNLGCLGQISPCSTPPVSPLTPALLKITLQGALKLLDQLQKMLAAGHSSGSPSRRQTHAPFSCLSPAPPEPHSILFASDLPLTAASSPVLPFQPQSQPPDINW